MTNKFLFSKKGDAPTGSQAATLVVIFALLIIFYLLFIPPDVRDQILEGDGENITSTSTVSNSTFLLETPGTLEEMAERDIDHFLNPVYLYATEEATILESVQSLEIKQSWFSDKDAQMTFEIDDKENVENALLSFIAENREGSITILLNDEEIFSGEISSVNVEPIVLKSKYQKEGINTIKFEVSEVGWAFWKTNNYLLKNLQVTADVTDVSEQMSKNIFVVSTTEKNNVEKAILRFTPDCTSGQAGTLDVLMNGHLVYSAVPDCGSPTATEFIPEVLRVGENQVVFKTNRGNYLIDLIKITSEMKQNLQPVYYFDVGQEDFEDIKDDLVDVNLKMVFAEGKERKAGKIIINGVETALYQTSREYFKKINDFISKGSNAIKIVPDNRLEIASIEVVKE